MPSRHSSHHSVEDARRLAENLGVDHEVIPIDPIQRAYEGTPVVTGDLASQPGGLADQNLQSRIRGALVMIRSNRHGWLPLATGNKSELAVGYCTLYGDMAGGFAVLCDIFKRDVYAVSRYINETVEKRELIPVEHSDESAQCRAGAESIRSGHASPLRSLGRNPGRADRTGDVGLGPQPALPGRHRPLGGAAA